MEFRQTGVHIRKSLDRAKLQTDIWQAWGKFGDPAHFQLKMFASFVLFPWRAKQPENAVLRDLGRNYPLALAEASLRSM